jgi:hypothetical protein
MIRTQIQLPEEEYEQLRRAAAKERRSIADCIREGIRWFLRQGESADDDLAAVAGKFRPLPIDDLKPHDRRHVEGIERSKRRKAP